MWQKTKTWGLCWSENNSREPKLHLGWMDGWSKDFPQELPRAGLKADWFSDPCIYGELFQTLLGWYQDQTTLGNSLVRFCQENGRLEVNSVLGVNTDEREGLLISD